MKIIEGLKYSKNHEWVKSDGSRAYVGITDFAQHALGQIVFVELPEIGACLAADETIGVVESIKAASDIYTPIAGKVIEINEALSDNPDSINENPFESWIAVLEISDASPLDGLMDAGEYEIFCSEEE